MKSIADSPIPASARQYSTACRGKARVVLLAREALFLRGGDDLAVLDQGRGAVVVEGGDAQDAHAAQRPRTECR